jgi:hypothetical protein
MVTVEKLSARHRLAERPVEIPLAILLAIPGYVARDAPPGALPDLFGALTAVLHAASQDEADRIFRPRVWAPAWSETELASAVGFSHWSALPPERLRARRAPLDPTALRDDESGRADIVHLVARVELENGPRGPQAALVVEHDGDRRVSVSAAGLRDALVMAGVRLLVLHPPPYQAPFPFADDLAREIVEDGGPAILVAMENHADPSLRETLQGFYAELSHDRVLSDAAWGFDGTLFLGEGGEGLLQFHPYIEALRTRARAVARTAEEALGMKELLAELSGYLHQAEVSQMEADAAALANLANELESGAAYRVEELQRLGELAWSHEGEGVIPLSREMAALKSLEASAGSAAERYEAVERELLSTAERGPRVLNANVAEPETGRVLDPTDALIVGRRYELLVDVGPRWSEIRSLVRGSGLFPERALPPGAEGHELDLVLVGEHLEQDLVTARIWLPAERGRSYPVENDRRLDRPRPIALPFNPAVRTEWALDPDVGSPMPPVRGRLSVYFRGTLLQSAVVTARLASADGPSPPGENRVDVDFAITGTFQDLAAEFGRRQLTLGGRLQGGLPVGASIALNDDGAGGHRLVIACGPEGSDSLLAGWVPYNPVAASDLLRQARADLLECFYQGEEAARRVGLDRDNGKGYDEFRFDLKRLALRGRDLYAVATAQARSDQGGDARDFSAGLRKALAEPRVIQVGRTLLAEYAFPWALIYDIPLAGPRYLFCKVVKDWEQGGRRRGGGGATCPHKNEPWHRENIFCPYGFWGLRHVVEQPLTIVDTRTGALDVRNAPREVRRRDQRLDVGVAVTADSALDAGRMRDHLARLSGIHPCRLTPAPPATDVDGVRAMLPDTSVVYFLCHGEVDDRRKAYLGIGPRDGHVNHRIYARMVQDWADTDVPPNLSGWREARPLVIINGCHTTSLSPEEVLSFVSAFGFARASGVLGTEVAVLLEVAVEFAELFLERVAAGETVGDSLYAARWALADKGNLLGLAYSLFSRADLRFVYQERP